MKEKRPAIKKPEIPYSFAKEADDIVENKLNQMLCGVYQRFTELRNNPNQPNVERDVLSMNKVINLVVGPRSALSDELYNEARIRMHLDFQGNKTLSIGEEWELPDLRQPMKARRAK